MKFYSLITDRDTPFQTQVDQVSEKLLKKNLYKKLRKKNITGLVLDDDAKVTDFLSNGTLNITGHIISNKVVRLFEKFNLYDVQFVDINSPGLEGYKFMLFNSDLTDRLDYSKSNFQLIKKTPLKESVVDLTITPKRKAIIKVHLNECVRSIFHFLVPKDGYIFTRKFDLASYDAFRIGHFDKSFYISQRLFESLKEHKVTGFECIEQPLLKTIVEN